MEPILEPINWIWTHWYRFIPLAAYLVILFMFWLLLREDKHPCRD